MLSVVESAGPSGGGVGALGETSAKGGSGRSRCRVYGLPVDAVI